VAVTAATAEAARAALDVVEAFAATVAGLDVAPASLEGPDGPGLVSAAPVLIIESDDLEANTGALSHAEELAGYLARYDLTAALRAQGLAVAATSVLGSQVALPLLPSPPVGPGEHSPPRRRHASQTLVFLVEWLPMTWRAISARPVKYTFS